MDPLPFRFLQAQLKQRRRRRHDQDGPARATTTRPQPPGGNRAPGQDNNAQVWAGNLPVCVSADINIA